MNDGPVTTTAAAGDNSFVLFGSSTSSRWFSLTLGCGRDDIRLQATQASEAMQKVKKQNRSFLHRQQNFSGWNWSVCWETGSKRKTIVEKLIAFLRRVWVINYFTQTHTHSHRGMRKWKIYVLINIPLLLGHDVCRLLMSGQLSTGMQIATSYARSQNRSKRKCKRMQLFEMNVNVWVCVFSPCNGFVLEVPSGVDLSEQESYCW